MNEPAKIRVLLADDHRMLREALGLVLPPRCEVVGEAGDGETAIALAEELRPDVVVLDLEMPGIGGIAAARRIAKRAPGVKVLILTQFRDEQYVLETLGEAGAAGYLLKEDAAEELRSAVLAVHEGRRYLSSGVAPIVIAQLSSTRSERAARGEPKLTNREREILRLVAEGETNKEIASRLGISPKTAQVHRDNLKQKLDLKTTAAMVRWALAHKLVRAGRSH